MLLLYFLLLLWLLASLSGVTFDGDVAVGAGVGVAVGVVRQMLARMLVLLPRTAICVELKLLLGVALHVRLFVLMLLFCLGVMSGDAWPWIHLVM